MLIKWFWCLKCDGTHFDKVIQRNIPHLMPFKGQMLKAKLCKCGLSGFIFKSLEAA